MVLISDSEVIAAFNSGQPKNSVSFGFEQTYRKSIVSSDLRSRQNWA